jgi:hypothetical protein
MRGMGLILSLQYYLLAAYDTFGFCSTSILPCVPWKSLQRRFSRKEKNTRSKTPRQIRAAGAVASEHHEVTAWGVVA